MLNATNFAEFQGYRFNIQTSTVDKFNEALIIPNISYKLKTIGITSNHEICK